MFQVSDQVQTLLDKGLLNEHSTDVHKVHLRQPKAHERLPAILESGKDVTSFDPDWAVVRVQDGVPNKCVPMFTMKLSKDLPVFPVDNRASVGGKGSTAPTKKDVRDLLKQTLNWPSWQRLADFHLLWCIACQWDIELACVCAKAVADRDASIPQSVFDKLMKEVSCPHRGGGGSMC